MPFKAGGCLSSFYADKGRIWCDGGSLREVDLHEDYRFRFFGKKGTLMFAPKCNNPCYSLQRPVNAHFEAVSGLQFCWQAQDFQAFFIGKGAKVLVYAVFRACGNFRGLGPQTFRPHCSFSCHGAR